MRSPLLSAMIFQRASKDTKSRHPAVYTATVKANLSNVCYFYL